MTGKEELIIDLLQQANKSLARAIVLMEFLVGEKLERDKAQIATRTHTINKEAT